MNYTQWKGCVKCRFSQVSLARSSRATAKAPVLGADLVACDVYARRQQ